MLHNLNIIRGWRRGRKNSSRLSKLLAGCRKRLGRKAGRRSGERGRGSGGWGRLRALPGPGSGLCFERLLRMSGSWVEAGWEPSELVRTKAKALNLDRPGLSGIFNFLPCSCSERRSSRRGGAGRGGAEMEFKKKIILEMGQLSVNTLIILPGEGPSCALSAGKMQEVFNHMQSTLFC